MKKILTLLLTAGTLISLAQDLQPGFSKEEYRQMMLISIRSVKSSNYEKDYPPPNGFNMIYQSANIGLENSWDLWSDNKSTAVVSFRGTTAAPVSWLENFYAAMVPAKGELKTDKDTPAFRYDLADHPAAAVHAGWLLGMAIMSLEIMPRLDSLHKAGTRNLLIVGHSQGGGIAYLMTAHLLSLQKKGEFPSGIRIKTYCSAAPKPGNLPFAYAYESMTQNGWAFNVVNALDWVPETPFSIQNLDDFNVSNPFIHARTLIRKQKFPINIAMSHVYRKLDRPTRKAGRRFVKYMGKMPERMTKKVIPGLEMPAFAGTNNYVRTGNTIVLYPDEAYLKDYPAKSADVFIHHFHKPYLVLLDKLDQPFYDKKEELSGKWELTYITGTRIAFEGLFPGQKPHLQFTPEGISGNTACNPFSTVFKTSGSDSITIDPPKAMTMRFCEGGGETQFLKILQRVDRWKRQGDVLSFYIGDTEAMRFKAIPML